MQRTQISLTEHERRLLDAEAARTGRSMSALIRDAIDARYGDERSLDDALAAMDRGFGVWTDRDADGVQYVERLRSGRRLRSTR